jgi:hypothetical protein
MMSVLERGTETGKKYDRRVNGNEKSWEKGETFYYRSRSTILSEGCQT